MDEPWVAAMVSNLAEPMVEMKVVLSVGLRVAM